MTSVMVSEMAPSSRPAVSKFQHDLLPDSTTHMRLLQILKGGFGKHIECKLTTWHADEVPMYYAISYTWGEPVSTASIIINGGEKLVRPNCEYVLQQLATLNLSDYYWIDALCINQDNTQERSHQVAMMGQIYSGAAHVLACVGPHAADSEFLIALIDRYKTLFSSIHDVTLGYPRPAFGNIHISWGNLPVLLLLKCVRSLKPNTMRSLFEAYIKFMKRPYFLRLWILQELSLASELSFVCGKHARPFRYFRAIDKLLDFWKDLAWDSPYGWRDLVYLLSKIYDLVYLLSKIYWHNIKYDNPTWDVLNERLGDIEEQRICLDIACKANIKYNLYGSLRFIAKYECAGLRDKLFGILNLINCQEKSLLVPDYTKSNFEVAIMALEICMRSIHTSISSFATGLDEVFNLSPDETKMRDAICARYSGRNLPRRFTTRAVEPMSSITSMLLKEDRTPLCIRSPIARVELACSERWRGIPLRCSDRAVTCSQQRKYLVLKKTRSSVEEYCQIVDDRGKILASVSTSVGDGDYILHELFSGYMMIARKPDTQTDRYNLMCLVFQHENIEYCQFDYLDFKVTWGDPEDILFLAWSCRVIKERRETALPHEIADWAKLRICAREGSAFAEQFKPEDSESD